MPARLRGDHEGRPYESIPQTSKIFEARLGYLPTGTQAPELLDTILKSNSGIGVP